MGRLGPGARRLALALATAAVCACSPIYRDHGYVPLESDLEQVVVGETTRDEVATIVGRPSSSGVLSGSGWYYVGSRFKQVGPRAPQEIDRQVVAISFDEKGVVENVERFGLEDGKVITISRRVTDSGIRGIGILRQLFGNIGRLSAAQLTGN